MATRMKAVARQYLPFIVKLAKTVRDYARQQVAKGKIKHLLRERKEIFVEVGAGDVKGKNGWTTIDMAKNCDILWDLRKGLPFPDRRLSKIYSSHFFEHLSYKEIRLFLKECRRALAPGGEFSICVPNARIWIDAYAKKTPLDEDIFLGYKPAYNRTTILDYVNYMAYMDGEHKYMFDEENLLFILQDAGFTNVRPRPFDPELDMKERRIESLYALAENQ